MIVIQVIDEDGIVEEKIGEVTEKELLEFINTCEKRNLKCLSFLDIGSDTIFNEKQLYQIKKEVTELEKDKQINQHILQLIKNGIKSALSDVFLYLIFRSSN